MIDLKVIAKKNFSTPSSSSTSAAESDEKSVKEKGLCFKVYIDLTILKDQKLRCIQGSTNCLSWNALKKYIMLDKLFILDVLQSPGYASAYAVMVKNL